MSMQETHTLSVKQKLRQLQLSCKQVKMQLEQTKFYYEKLIIQMTKGFRILTKVNNVNQSFTQSVKCTKIKHPKIKQQTKVDKYGICIMDADMDKQNQQARSNFNSSQHLMRIQQKNTSSKRNNNKERLTHISNKYKNNQIANQSKIQKSKSLHSIKTYKQRRSLNMDITQLRQKMQDQLLQIRMLQNRQHLLDKSTQRIQNYLTEQRYNMNSHKTKQSSNFSKNQIKKSKVKSEVSLTEFNLEENQKALQSIVINQLNPSTLKQRQKQHNCSLNSTQLYCSSKHIFYKGDLNIYQNQQKNVPNGEGKYHKCCNQASVALNLSSQVQYYQGEFQNGKFHGQGTITYVGGVKFIGQFKDGKRHGKGCLYLNGKCQMGIWKNEFLIGLI